MRNPEWNRVIEKNRAIACDLGISETPGFIVGTELAPGAVDLQGLEDRDCKGGKREVTERLLRWMAGRG